MGDRLTVDDLLESARRDLERLTPQEAYEATRAGAVVVDVRSMDEQARQGAVIAGSLHYPLSVLLWRLDPDVPGENPKLPLDTHVILICRQGYCSGLAASQLRQIGFERATDVIGGVERWLEDGLPTEPWH